MGYRNFRQSIVHFEDFNIEKLQSDFQSKIDLIFADIDVELGLSESNTGEHFDRMDECTLIYDKFNQSYKH